MNNTWEILSEKLSLTPAVKTTLEVDIFSFNEFIPALALLLIVYTTTSTRYKFRLSIVPFDLKIVSFILLLLIGFGTLIMELWFSKGWLIPAYISSYIYLQIFFAILFLFTILLWIYYAFIKPPIFSKTNYIKYMQESYRIIINGSENDLFMLSNEIKRSASSIIKASSEVKKRYVKSNDKYRSHEPQHYLQPDNEYSRIAYDLLLLIANKKFCKQVIKTSPGTVIKFINEIERSKKFDVPIAQFLQNISLEAIFDKNSILYHENEMFTFDLIGNDKLFTKTLYGNYDLLKSFDFLNPFYIDYEVRNSLDSEQYKILSRAILISMKAYVKNEGVYWSHSASFRDALKIIEESTSKMYKLKNIKDFEIISSNISYKKLEITTSFIRDFVEILEKHPSKYYKISKNKDDSIERDIYEKLVSIIVKTILNISDVKLSKWNTWWIHHNIFWSEILRTNEKNLKVKKIIKYKLRRAIYSEIMKFNKYSIYPSAKMLGYILNIFGLKAKRNTYYKEWYWFHKLILNWTKKNYLIILTKDEDIAKACLIGNLEYDKKKQKLRYKGRKESLKLIKKEENGY